MPAAGCSSASVGRDAMISKFAPVLACMNPYIQRLCKCFYIYIYVYTYMHARSGVARTDAKLQKVIFLSSLQKAKDEATAFRVRFGRPLQQVREEGVPSPYHSKSGRSLFGSAIPKCSLPLCTHLTPCPGVYTHTHARDKPGYNRRCLTGPTGGRHSIKQGYDMDAVQSVTNIAASILQSFATLEIRSASYTSRHTATCSTCSLAHVLTLAQTLTPQSCLRRDTCKPLK